MGEVLTDLNRVPSVDGAEKRIDTDGVLTYRDRLRRGFSQAAEGTASFINLSASIGLARDDLRLTREAMDRLDTAHDGLLARQSTDIISVELGSDIILDYKRDAQREGYTDLDTMPAELRAQVAHGAVDTYRDQIRQEFEAAHPEWSSEELDEAAAQRAADVSTLLGMTTEEYSVFAQNQIEYQNLSGASAEIQAELSEMRAERSARISRLGRTAMTGLVGFVGKVRNAPNALSARAMVAGMSIGDRVRSMSPENRRRTFAGTAAGLAVAGIAAFIAYRAGHVPSGNANYALMSAESPLLPTGVGAEHLPVGVGDVQLPTGVGEFAIPSSVGMDTPLSVGDIDLPGGVGAETLPTGIGETLPVGIGDTDIPTGVGETLPTGIGDAQSLPTGVGSPNLPTGVGESVPSSVGADLPGTVGVGGENLSSVQSSSELFDSNGSVETWPAKIRVGEWNGKTLDGSLTGISRQMLVRSGVPSPSTDQINVLVEALRPQAQPNGWLLKGQELDLRPATSALKSLLKN